ncbi:hypothetical protein CRUP_032226 [Coryphaenoides rupestris]|nr:hypothetical protein CRUP_032226 [Coryphaenoides rupestris]
MLPEINIKSSRSDTFPHPHRLHLEGTGLGVNNPYTQEERPKPAQPFGGRFRGPRDNVPTRTPGPKQEKEKAFEGQRLPLSPHR